jgi:hypothetical protein
MELRAGLPVSFAVATILYFTRSPQLNAVMVLHSVWRFLQTFMQSVAATLAAARLPQAEVCSLDACFSRFVVVVTTK